MELKQWDNSDSILYLKRLMTNCIRNQLRTTTSNKKQKTKNKKQKTKNVTKM